MSCRTTPISFQQRLAQLKQKQLELQDQFAQSHASTERVQELEAMLIEVGKEVAELEILLSAA